MILVKICRIDELCLIDNLSTIITFLQNLQESYKNQGWRDMRVERSLQNGQVWLFGRKMRENELCESCRRFESDCKCS